MGNSLQSVLQDKDFLAARPEDQTAYLASIDKDFAKASKQEQDEYLNHILGRPTEPNLKTGAGMEEQSQRQAKQYGTERATAPYEQQHEEMQRRNIMAHNLENANITPFTNASMAYFPASSARALVGSKVGSKAGEYVGAQISPEAEQYGQVIGGTVGGVGASLPWENIGSWRTSLSRAVRNPATGRVQSPWEMAVNKVLPDPDLPAAIPAKMIPKGTNYGQYLSAERAAAAEAAQAPRIVRPGAEVGPRATGSEGRAATWTNEDVMRLAQQGNRIAIEQAIRRGMQLPANARYVMGDPDVSRAVYNPKSTTRFTPEGEPIRDVANPVVAAPRERIQVEPVAQPRETINAATGEVIVPKPKYPIGVETRFQPRSEYAAPEAESATEAARRGAAGKNPAMRSVERHNEKLRKINSAAIRRGERAARGGQRKKGGGD